MLTSDQTRSPVYLNCAACRHEWVAVYVPIEVKAFCKAINRATCPSCGETKKLFMGRRPETEAAPGHAKEGA